MRILASIAFAGTVALGAAGAHAADLAPPVYPAPPAAAAIEGGWYLRGDIGLASNTIGAFDVMQNGQPVRAGAGGVNTFELRTKTFSETISVGVGVGYRFNSWLRADVTGEFRGGGRLRGLDYVNFDGGGGSTTSQTNTYAGDVRSWVGLVNAYVDLGTFCTLGCLTPYLGAGFGFANTAISNFTDSSAGFNSDWGATGSLGGYATSVSKTNFAWALMAGVGYRVNDRLSLELGYRYLNLGDLPEIGLRDPATGLPQPSGDAIRVRNLSSHEVRLGMRWMLNCTCAAPAPIVARY